MERKKWTIENLPKGYPTKCNGIDLSNAIGDLSDELISKSVKDNKDYRNIGWRERIIAFVQLGHSELQQRNNNIVLIISLFTLGVALIALFLNFFQFPP